MKVPAALSPGEELLARHLDCYRIPYEREVCAVPTRRYRWDFRVQDLLIEVQGQIWRKGAHSSGAGLTRDFAKANAACIAGYRTLFFSTEQVVSGYAIDTVRTALKR